MGEPVKMRTLAANLIRLSGAHAGPEGLVYTGLRPGERLHEELVSPEEETVPTRIAKVRLVRAPELMATPSPPAWKPGRSA